MIITDSLFLIGNSHSKCDDYALSGKAGSLNYIIVSDGCSSSKNTDIGSRVLALCAKEVIFGMSFLKDRFLRYKDFGLKVIEQAKNIANLEFGLCTTSLDSTLLCFVYDEESKECRFYCYGDGSIYVENCEGSIFETYEFKSGAPYYLSYLLNESRDKAYKEQYGDFPLISNAYNSKRDNFTASYQYFEQIHPIIFNTNKDFKVVLFTDGISSFVNKHTSELIEANDIVGSFVNFKNFGESFLQRRINREVKTLAKHFIVHEDDFSCSCMIKED